MRAKQSPVKIHVYAVEPEIASSPGSSPGLKALLAMTNILSMSAIEKDFTIKIIILFAATFAGIFGIWYALMREESVDWLSSQISHQVSPYAVTETEDGLIISNVLIGYGFKMPVGFKTTGAKNFSFYKEEAGEKKCEIKHFYSDADKVNGLVAGEAKLIVPLGQQKLVFELVNKFEQNNCGKYLLDIKNNLEFN